MKVNMVGGGFQHEWCSSGFNENKHIEWVKDGSADTSIHIDWAILESIGDKSKKKYGWLAESSAIIHELIEKFKSSIDIMTDEYELIFTHDKRLLGLSPKMRLVLPNATPWVQDKNIHEKTKLVSMIASNKTMCPGHMYRQNIIQKYRGKLDHYGRGFRALNKKEDGLKDYMFSVAMENDNYPNIFCEKITDCFAMGTIPIFWGTPDIGDMFNIDGVILLDENFNIDDLTPELYYSKMEAIKDNYQRALDLPTAEDYILLNYLK